MFFAWIIGNVEHVRKLDIKKLYKLTKAGIVILTLFLMLKFILDNQDAKSVVSLYRYNLDNCPPIKYSQDYNNCVSKADKQYNQSMAENQSRGDIALIVLIPTLFFGGEWVYRYLFPIKK